LEFDAWLPDGGRDWVQVSDVLEIFAGLESDRAAGGMRTSLPVRGLRPMPRLAGFHLEDADPRSSIRSPRCIEVRIASKTASTATSALTLVMSAIFETSLNECRP